MPRPDACVPTPCRCREALRTAAHRAGRDRRVPAAVVPPRPSSAPWSRRAVRRRWSRPAPVSRARSGRRPFRSRSAGAGRPPVPAAPVPPRLSVRSTWLASRHPLDEMANAAARRTRHRRDYAIPDRPDRSCLLKVPPALVDRVTNFAAREPSALAIVYWQTGGDRAVPPGRTHGIWHPRRHRPRHQQLRDRARSTATPSRSSPTPPARR